ncbi:methyltransferase domain-containing protein [Streptomyces sp. AP-93]|uniref:class I SAM-dependent methyltransferase n=1 Tax=Streptomyces sp. AP-93 TaxID=2929048 RepID=UPI001FAEB0C9|nr:methyltransferase domain-containing protein [Streptomyces sp. AP-93]MCJ0872663.1 class I SAM-dependent methyltransferase [Streptomyces sp. AP-93]
MSTAASMRISGPEPWQRGPYAEAIGAAKGRLTLRDAEGWCLSLDVRRWCAQADVSDRSVVDRCAGRVLDIGCGAGRLVEEAARRGHRVLGIDVCPTAVISTVCRGGRAISRSVFEPLPGEGRWDTALLVDGNIGIGGDPRRLLERIHGVVRDRGLLIVETAPIDVDERRRVRIHAGRAAASPVFAWATVGTRALLRHGRMSGWTPVEQWAGPSGERHFVALRARA